MGQKISPLNKECTSTHKKKKMWDFFYESYPVIFHFFSSYLLLRTESKKTKEKYLCCVQKFCQIELHNSSSRFDEFLDVICSFTFWAQGNNALATYE